MINLSGMQKDQLVDRVGNSTAAIQMSKDRILAGRAGTDEINMCVDSSQSLVDFFRKLQKELEND